MVSSADETPDVVHEHDSLYIVVHVRDATLLKENGFKSLRRHISINLARAHPKDVYFLAYYRDEGDGVLSVRMALHSVSDLKNMERTEMFLQAIVDTYDCRSSASAVCSATRAATIDPNFAISSVEFESGVRPRRARGVVNDWRTSRPTACAYPMAHAV